ncbi:MAG: hypothetical protein NT009_03275 [Proteobacteria bacterium]|nr:hypothetical protein [Pseudomonadota bacterium]
MAFCPICRSEYLPHIHVCAECGAALTDALPSTESPDSKSPSVEILASDNSIELQMAIGLLEENRIPFLLGKPDLDPFRLNTPGHAIRVLEPDAKKARELLEIYLKSEGTRFICESCGAELAELPETCPKCGKSPTG